jgi:hypothetical protein
MKKPGLLVAWTHWLRNWETLYLIGKGMGDSMVGLLAD